MMREYSILWQLRREPCPRVDLFLTELEALLRKHDINLVYDEDLQCLVAVPFEENQLALLTTLAVSQEILNYQPSGGDRADREPGVN